MKLSFYVVSSPGLEDITLAEVRSLGYPKAKRIEGGVSIIGSTRDLYRCNFLLRTASRIYLRLCEGETHRFTDIAKLLARCELNQFADKDTPITVSATSHASTLYHTGAIEKAAREAIELGGLSTLGKQNEVGDDRKIQLSIRIVRNQCTVSLDTSGAPLHHRGYKLAAGSAPLRETLAAAILRAVDWNPSVPVIDPFCGSGTIPIEAAMVAGNIAPGVLRTFGFHRWPALNRGAWSSVVSEVGAKGAEPGEEEARSPLANTFSIEGSDLNCETTTQAHKNAERARVGHIVRFYCRDACDLPQLLPGSLIICNPPYGARLEEPGFALKLLNRFGLAAKKRAKGSTLAVLLPSGLPASSLGLSVEEKLCFLHGGKRVRLYCGVVG